MFLPGRVSTDGCIRRRATSSCAGTWRTGTSTTSRPAHGKLWHQFAFWFGGNVNVFNVVLGAVTVSIGALLIALHATQGPWLGVPQSIQSWGQFRFYGSAFMFPAVLLLSVGFIAAELVIQA